jgi:hypothetical protein
VHISRCCATTRILLLPQSGPCGGAEAAAAAAEACQRCAQAPPLPRPLALAVRCRQLQLCLWDDERRRLLPAPPADAALGRELFALTADNLQLDLARQLRFAPGVDAAAAAGEAAGPPLHLWQRQPLVAMSAGLAVAAVQLDSFLPSGEQPVLLVSVPDEGLGGTAAAGRRRGPALQLLLEVHHCPQLPRSCSPGSGEQAEAAAMSFRNCWVHNLLVRLPTLAAAADDALLLFADRLSGLLGGGGGGEAAPGSDGEPSGAAAVLDPAAAARSALAAEAAGAAASRLYTERAVVESGEGCR